MTDKTKHFLFAVAFATFMILVVFGPEVKKLCAIGASAATHSQV